MTRKQIDGQHQYLVTPWDYDINKNEAHSTYDQFIQLRDTLIFSGKYYNNKAGKKLIVGEKMDWSTTNTIEIWENNYIKISFEPWYQGWLYTLEALGKYITQTTGTDAQTYGILSFKINKDWRYRVVHKEEVLPTSSQSKVYCYVDIYRKVNDNYEILLKGGIAVFDWETRSGFDYSLGEMFKKVTAFGYNERDLKKWDILVLRMRDAETNADWSPAGNELTIQQWSNFLSIEYIDTPYNQ